MKITPLIYALIFVFLTTLTACGEIDAKIVVVDEDGTPMKDADVEVFFQAYQTTKDKKESQVTDEGGLVSFTGAPEASLRIRVSKAGYYSSDFKDLDPTVDLNLKVTLRAELKPTALFSKRVILKMPIANEWIGYDLEKGDFVAPFGKGVREDFFLRMASVETLPNGKANPAAEGKMELSFPNSYDGYVYEKEKFMKESQMKMSHRAPESGYENPFVRSENSYSNVNLGRNTGIFFRVRSIEDHEGNLLSANYGKFSSDIQFDPRESGWHVADKNKPKTYGTISFTYYFNPRVNDRNLEFDPAQNLFENLSRDEQVFEP